MAATLKDIAQKLDISITTVSRGLAGYSDVSEKTRKRIEAAAKELGYQPNITARRLQKQKTDTLGFIIPTFGPRFSDPFFSEFLAGVGNKAAEAEYDLLVSTHAPYSAAEQQAYLRATQGGWVDGLIIVRTRENDERIRHLSEQTFPFVSFGRTDLDADYPFVDEDSVAGMRQVTEHFIELGHRRIGFIMPPAELMFSNLRRLGYQQAMADRGLAVEPDWIVEGNLTQRGGAEVVDRLLALQPRLTAIICGNDLMAIGAMNRIQQQGLEVGKDMAIAGFDDIPTAAYTTPSLTTVAQPIYEIGWQTCEMLIDLINGRSLQNRQVLLTPKLVIRASSGTAVG